LSKSYEEIEKVYRKLLLPHVSIVTDDDEQWKYISECVPKDKNSFVLDAGCGNGKYTFRLAQMGYKNLYAVDLFTEIRTEGFVYRQASIDNLPYRSEFFDFVFSNSVIYYLPDPNEGIKEFRRVLKPNGLLFFTAHTKYSIFTLWRIFKRDVFRSKNMEHLKGVKFYSARYYRKLLEKNGFELIRQDGYDTSFIIYPFYEKLSRMFEKYFGMKLPSIGFCPEYKWIRIIKSEISYHSVFIARKK